MAQVTATSASRKVMARARRGTRDAVADPDRLASQARKRPVRRCLGRLAPAQVGGEVAGRRVQAQPNTLMIIDEPELHVHRSIMSKLWDEEAIRMSPGAPAVNFAAFAPGTPERFTNPPASIDIEKIVVSVDWFAIDNYRRSGRVLATEGARQTICLMVAGGHLR